MTARAVLEGWGDVLEVEVDGHAFVVCRHGVIVRWPEWNPLTGALHRALLPSRGVLVSGFDLAWPFMVDTRSSGEWAPALLARDVHELVTLASGDAFDVWGLPRVPLSKMRATRGEVVVFMRQAWRRWQAVLEQPTAEDFDTDPRGALARLDAAARAAWSLTRPGVDRPGPGAACLYSLQAAVERGPNPARLGRFHPLGSAYAASWLVGARASYLRSAATFRRRAVATDCSAHRKRLLRRAKRDLNNARARRPRSKARE